MNAFAEKPLVIVGEGSSRGWPAAVLSRLGDIYQYRELLRNLVLRDLKARYKGTVFGFFWSLFNPLLMTIIFVLLFTVLMRNNAIPNFPVFVLIGILAWNFHSTAVMGSIGSITGNSQLISKIYFPREILPLAVVLANGVNFLLALLVLMAFILFFRVPVGWSLALFPLVFLIQLLFTVGFGLFFATLNVFYRDTGIIMESLMLAWFFLSPVFYRPQDLFPDYERLMYILNPMASVIAMYRDILYSGGVPDGLFVLRSALQALLLLTIGWALFSRFSDRFVEEL